MNYAILRFRKLKSAAQIRRVGRHNEREVSPLNAEVEMRNANIDYRSESRGTLVERVNRRIGKRQRRRDAVLAVEVLMGYSPQAQKTIDAWSWGIASLDWLEKEFGRDNVVSARLHTDEKTVHLAAVCVPLDPKGRLNCKFYTGGPAKLRALQTRYAAAVSRFGLVRGEPGSRRRHIPIRDLYRDSNLLEQEAEKAIQVIRVLRKQPQIVIPAKALLESHADYQSRIAEIVRELLQRLWQRIEDAIFKLSESGKHVGLLNAERVSKRNTLKRLRLAEKQKVAAEERAIAAEEKLVKKEAQISELDKALANVCRQIPLKTVACDLLAPSGQQRDGVTEFRTKRHHLCIEGNKFKLQDHIEPDAAPRKGKNSIDLVMALMHVDYPRAVQYLSAKFGSEKTISEVLARSKQTAETLCHAPLGFTAAERAEALHFKLPRSEKSLPHFSGERKGTPPPL